MQRCEKYFVLTVPRCGKRFLFSLYEEWKKLLEDLMEAAVAEMNLVYEKDADDISILQTVYTWHPESTHRIQLPKITKRIRIPWYTSGFK